MKYYKFLFIFLLSFLFLGCGISSAEKVADEFHKKLDEKDYSYIVDNLADLTSEATSEDWTAFLELVDTWGPQSNRKKVGGFNKKISNGKSTIKLSYTFDIEKFGLVYERVVLIDVNGTYKLYTVLMDSDESVVIEGTEQF